MDDSPRLRRVFAARLVQARALRGLSQRELGKKMGLSKAEGFAKNTGSSRINRYERGANSINLDNLEAVADALGVPPAYLVAETKELANNTLLMAGEAYLGAHPAASVMLGWLQLAPELLFALDIWARTPEDQRPRSDVLVKALMDCLQARVG